MSYFYLSAKICIYFVQAGEVTDEAILASPGTVAARMEVTAFKDSLVTDNGRAHGAIFVGAGAEQQRRLAPKCKSHALDSIRAR